MQQVLTRRSSSCHQRRLLEAPAGWVLAHAGCTCSSASAGPSTSAPQHHNLWHYAQLHPASPAPARRRRGVAGRGGLALVRDGPGDTLATQQENVQGFFDAEAVPEVPATPSQQHGVALVGPSSLRDWPRKSSLYILRTDGKSCSRELVTGTGKLHFAFPSTQQHLLVWRNRPQSVMVLKKLGGELLEEFFEVLSYLGEEHGLKVLVEPALYMEHVVHRPQYAMHVHTYAPEEESRLAEFVDFVVCLGGDGVILHASHLFQHHIPPVMAFNLGSLGFLTNSSFDEYRGELSGVIYGSQQLDSCSMTFDSIDETSNTLGVMVTLRMRLCCEIVRAGNEQQPEQVYEVLNEVVIDRGSSSFLTNIECYEKGRFITRVQADGIMLATPTGSTAYSVAAGGSMVHPNVPAILLTPVCPHTLSFRPIVLPDYAELELRIPHDARCSAWVCFDGRSRQELGQGDTVRVRMSENPVPTINKTDLTGDWFDSLERCFQWNDRSQQKPLSSTSPPPLAQLPSPASASSSNGSGPRRLSPVVVALQAPPSSSSAPCA